VGDKLMTERLRGRKNLPIIEDVQTEMAQSSAEFASTRKMEAKLSVSFASPPFGANHLLNQDPNYALSDKYVY
jgi:hypothetical protein